MDARSVWFRENGEGRPKEQLLIETMFCVYYLSKRSAVRETRALHLQPPFLNTFSLSVPSCGSRTSPVVAWHMCSTISPSHMDVDQFALASMSEDHKEGVEAFLERRKPRFRGR
jgi:hypothetical protein